MKLSCDSLDLSDALTQVGKALPLKKVMPILNGIKLKAEGDTLTLTATDLELSIEKKIKGIFSPKEKLLSLENILRNTSEKSIRKTLLSIRPRKTPLNLPTAKITAISRQWKPTNIPLSKTSTTKTLFIL